MTRSRRSIAWLCWPISTQGHRAKSLYERCIGSVNSSLLARIYAGNENFRNCNRPVRLRLSYYSEQGTLDAVEIISEAEEYIDCVSAKGENSSAESLFLILVLEQQKMINELIVKLSRVQK